MNYSATIQPAVRIYIYIKENSSINVCQRTKSAHFARPFREIDANDANDANRR